MLKIRHPEQFLYTEQTFVSNLHIIPKSQGLGIIGMAEIAVALHLSGEIKGSDGKPTSLNQIAKGFEMMFNFNFGDIYDKQDALFRRKPYNLTKVLDSLRNLIIKKDRQLNNR